MGVHFNALLTHIHLFFSLFSFFIIVPMTAVGGGMFYIKCHQLLLSSIPQGEQTHQHTLQIAFPYISLIKGPHCLFLSLWGFLIYLFVFNFILLFLFLFSRRSR